MTDIRFNSTTSDFELHTEDAITLLTQEQAYDIFASLGQLLLCEQRHYQELPEFQQDMMAVLHSNIADYVGHDPAAVQEPTPVISDCSIFALAHTRRSEDGRPAFRWIAAEFNKGEAVAGKIIQAEVDGNTSGKVLYNNLKSYLTGPCSLDHIRAMGRLLTSAEREVATTLGNAAYRSSLTDNIHALFMHDGFASMENLIESVNIDSLEIRYRNRAKMLLDVRGPVATITEKEMIAGANKMAELKVRCFNIFQRAFLKIVEGPNALNLSQHLKARIKGLPQPERVRIEAETALDLMQACLGSVWNVVAEAVTKQLGELASSDLILPVYNKDIVDQGAMLMGTAWTVATENCGDGPVYLSRKQLDDVEGYFSVLFNVINIATLERNNLDGILIGGEDHGTYADLVQFDSAFVNDGVYLFPLIK